MAPGSRSPYCADLVQQTEAAAVWRREPITSLDDALRIIEVVLGEMVRHGYAGSALERVRHAAEEAVLSALQQLQATTPGRPSRLSYQVNADYVLVEVEGRAGASNPPGLQGPHAAPPPGGGAGPPWLRSYAWLRCDRQDSRLQLCRYWTVA
jgi:hypothetical protein